MMISNNCPVISRHRKLSFLSGCHCLPKQQYNLLKTPWILPFSANFKNEHGAPHFLLLSNDLRVKMQLFAKFFFLLSWFRATWNSRCLFYLFVCSFLCVVFVFQQLHQARNNTTPIRFCYKKNYPWQKGIRLSHRRSKQHSSELLLFHCASSCLVLPHVSYGPCRSPKQIIKSPRYKGINRRSFQNKCLFYFFF